VSGPSLLLWDPEPAGRLVALDALREEFAVRAAEDDELPLRTARRTRPDLVVVVLRSVRIEPVVQLCRKLRSEPSARPEQEVRVVLVNAPVIRELRRLAEAEDLAEGYLEGEVGAEVLVDACRRVHAGERVDVRRPASGRVGAWLRGLFGS
jgi:DNA-binding NarL/FixJ family response regulator